MEQIKIIRNIAAVVMMFAIIFSVSACGSMNSVDSSLTESTADATVKSYRIEGNENYTLVCIDNHANIRSGNNGGMTRADYLDEKCKELIKD